MHGVVARSRESADSCVVVVDLVQLDMLVILIEYIKARSDGQSDRASMFSGYLDREGRCRQPVT